jgi:hypothetical protein
MTPFFFTSQDVFRELLEANHLTETELFVGFYKVNSGKPSMTWSESVDQAYPSDEPIFEFKRF